MNKDGFALVETLIVTTFVSAVFSIILLNIYPLIGEYEKREDYDDIDSKYNTFWIKKMIEDTFVFTNPETDADINKVCLRSLRGNVVCDAGFKIDKSGCSNYMVYHFNDKSKIVCENLFDKYGVENIYVTLYDIGSFKTAVINNKRSYSSNFVDYVKSLPSYSKYSSYNDAKYRVLVEFKRSALDGIEKNYTYNTYSTMEVRGNEDE